jgi:hypothetical protein
MATTYNVIAAVGEVSVAVNVLLSIIVSAILVYAAVSYTFRPGMEDLGDVIRAKVVDVTPSCESGMPGNCTIAVEFTYKKQVYQASLPSMKMPKKGDYIDIVLLRSSDSRLPVKEYVNYSSLSVMSIVSALVLCVIAGLLIRAAVASKPFAAGAGVLTFIQALGALV